MRDLGLLKTNEPFARLLTQGMVTKDGAKMSKSKGNSVDPQYIIDRYGADTVRTFMLFASPPEKDVEWSDEGATGAFRFLNRVWRLFDNNVELIKEFNSADTTSDNISDEIKELRYSTHLTIQKSLYDAIELMQFNTAIAAIMKHLNNVYSINNPESLTPAEKAVFSEACQIIPRLLYPYAPHISEELWSMAGHDRLIHEYGIPEFKEEYVNRDEAVYVVQVNGKVRGKISVSVSESEDNIKKFALETENVKKTIGEKAIRKIIVVPNKLVSIVI